MVLPGRNDDTGGLEDAGRDGWTVELERDDELPAGAEGAGALEDTMEMAALDETVTDPFCPALDREACGILGITLEVGWVPYSSELCSSSTWDSGPVNGAAFG